MYYKLKKLIEIKPKNENDLKHPQKLLFKSRQSHF